MAPPSQLSRWINVNELLDMLPLLPAERWRVSDLSSACCPPGVHEASSNCGCTSWSCRTRSDWSPSGLDVTTALKTAVRNNLSKCIGSLKLSFYSGWNICLIAANFKLWILLSERQWDQSSETSPTSCRWVLSLFILHIFIQSTCSSALLSTDVAVVSGSHSTQGGKCFSP